jgi:hypothetical protein
LDIINSKSSRFCQFLAGKVRVGAGSFTC